MPDKYQTNTDPVAPIVPTTEAVGYPEGVQADEKARKAKAPKSVAAEVAAGLWGRGNARTKRLKEAGHDPEEVMKAYNDLFGR